MKPCYMHATLKWNDWIDVVRNVFSTIDGDEIDFGGQWEWFMCIYINVIYINGYAQCLMTLSNKVEDMSFLTQ